jgi:hypothetical protein
VENQIAQQFLNELNNTENTSVEQWFVGRLDIGGQTFGYSGYQYPAGTIKFTYFPVK